MAVIQWEETLSVHVAEIDKQHQKLIGMINNLHEAMIQGKGKEILGKIIHDLILYTGTHFSTEERLFHQFGYPEAESHKKEHADFVKKVSDFKDGFAGEKIGLSIEVMNFLSNWLKNHIKKVDRAYAPFFQEKGLS